MNRSFKLPLLIALALGSTQLLAVDFGQVQVKSSLGQPLLAEIPVHAATAAELQQLIAEQASSDEYARAGITSGRTRVPLNFSVVTGAGGQHLIRITSTVAVDDPYVDLLLDVKTPAGRSVHEFAILLDPPGQAIPAVAEVPRPAAAPAAAPVAAPVARTTASTAAQPATGVVNGKYGPVARGQTLSGIALRTMPAGVDINQMLLALKQANPDAFYRDNINTLKSGAVLRIPAASEAQSVAMAAAIAEVRRQNNEWREAPAAVPATVADTAMRASASSAPTHAATGGGDRLALLAAKDTGKAGGAAAAGSAGTSAVELRKSLLQAQENLASVQQQAADLKSRLKDLTDINNKSTRLLSLKDSEIAELQAKLAAARKGTIAATPTAPKPAVSASVASTTPAAAAALATSPATNPAAASSTAHVAMAPAAAGAASAAPATPASVAAASAAAATKPASTPARYPAPGEQPWYMQTWAWIGAGGIVVLLILFALLGRQRKHPPAPTARRTAPSLADSFAGLPAAGGVSADDVDQEELLDQLAEHPDDIDLHLQLVTLYYSRRDVEHFEAAAEAMHAHIQDPEQDEWQDVVHMGEDLVPEHPLFDHHVSPSAAEAPLEDFNIDDYADDATVVRATAAALEDAPALDDLHHDDHADEPVADAHAAMFGAIDPPPILTGSGPRVPIDAVPGGPDEPASDVTLLQSAGLETENPSDELGEFNDDPIDTKLDLARAYLDMGDDEGARAMLDEVLKEGSQMQKDVATGLLDGLQP